MTPAERDNLARFREGDPAGHMESFFLKANAPEGGRAFWIRFTVFAPAGRARDAVAEVWAIAFDRARGHVAVKETYPVAAADLRRDRFRVAAGRSSLGPGATRGRLEGPAGAIEWDLAFTEGAPPAHLYPIEAFYDLDVFPRQKYLTPHPDSRFGGRIVAGGETWEVRDWPGMQGHTWGRGHALRYAWAHVNAFRDAPGTWFEGASAKIKLGPVPTPFLTLAFLRHAGRDYDFRGARHWINRSAEIGYYRWSFAAENDQARLEARVEARAEDLVGLLYLDPDGGRVHCLNSKIATCRLVLSERAGWKIGRTTTLEAPGAAALELLVREEDHGIAIRV